MLQLPAFLPIPAPLSWPCLFSPLLRPPPSPTLFPYTTLFRSESVADRGERPGTNFSTVGMATSRQAQTMRRKIQIGRSEEHTSELQSRGHLVCRLLLEKKKHPRRTSSAAAYTNAPPGASNHAA